MSISKKILIINTGGTFNKIYNPIKGELFVESGSKSLEDIASKWMSEFDIINIITKDSLEFTDNDREKLLITVKESSYNHIIIVHGTDTMSITAAYLSKMNLKKHIILTGAMVPYSIDPVEATANLSSAFGYLQCLNKEGIYIAMNGAFGSYNNIIKNYTHGKFVYG